MFAINTGLFRDTFGTIHREVTSVVVVGVGVGVVRISWVQEKGKEIRDVHNEVGSGMSGLNRSRARSTESQDSDEFFTSETFFAVTAPTISCWTVSLEGSIACSADVRVNSPHGRPMWADANTLKLTCA